MTTDILNIWTKGLRPDQELWTFGRITAPRLLEMDIKSRIAIDRQQNY